MNTSVIAPEVMAFVAAIRTELADLEPEELLEITDGLEADLTDLVAEQGAETLGDPVAYAAELRAAAGLAPATRRRTQFALSEGVDRLFASSRSRWRQVLDALPGGAAEFLASFQPVWWVLRAYVAAQSVLLWTGGWALTAIPDGSLGGGLITLALIALSVQLGRGQVPVLERWSARAAYRVLLVVLNLLALVMLPVVVNGLEDGRSQNYVQGYSRGYDEATRAAYRPEEGLYADGRWVSNIFPYDAAGSPLVGVQLYDQGGAPVDVVSAPECVYDEEGSTGFSRVYFPWTDGAAQQQNVFPVPSRVQGYSEPGSDPDPTPLTGSNRPTVSGFPFARVAKISLPGLLTTPARTPAKAFVSGPRLGPINPVDSGC